MVGSLEKSKDYGNLLRAWKVVEAAGPYELWIAGGGSKRAEFETLAGQLGLKRVRFLGAIEDVPSLLWSSTVFAFSANIEEGFGTVLIEALAAGCAVVATDVPACREVLEGGKYGRLVAAKDPGALGAAVIAALQCPLPAVESAQGVAYAQGFTAERMIESYLGIARGGLPIAGGIAYALGAKVVGTLNVEFYTGVDARLDEPVVLPPLLDLDALHGAKVLVVDDVADSGRTLALVLELIDGRVAEARSAVLFDKPASVVRPDYSWMRTEAWIEFPWSALPPVVDRPGARDA